MKTGIKVALSFPINKFPQSNILRNKRTYVIINASPEEICVEFKRKTLVYLLSNCPQVQKIFYD